MSKRSGENPGFQKRQPNTINFESKNGGVLDRSNSKETVKRIETIKPGVLKRNKMQNESAISIMSLSESKAEKKAEFIMGKIFGKNVEQAKKALGNLYLALFQSLKSHILGAYVFKKAQINLEGRVELVFNETKGKEYIYEIPEKFGKDMYDLHSFLDGNLLIDREKLDFLKTVGVGKERIQELMKNPSKFAEFKTFIDNLKQAGITKNFLDYGSLKTVLDLVSIGIQDEEIIYKMRKISAYALTVLAEALKNLRKIGTKEDQIQIALNKVDPENPLLELVKFSMAEYKKYCQQRGVPEDISKSFFETYGSIEYGSRLDEFIVIYNLVKDLNLPKRTILTLMAGAGAYPDVFRRLLQSFKKNHLREEEITKTLGSLYYYNESIINGIVEIVDAGVVADMYMLFIRLNSDDIANLPALMKLTPLMESKLILALRDKFGGIKNTLAEMKKLAKKTGKDLSFNAWELIHMLTADQNMKNMPKVIDYFDFIQNGFGLKSADVKELYQINPDIDKIQEKLGELFEKGLNIGDIIFVLKEKKDAKTIDFFAQIRQKFKTIDSNEIVQLSKCTENPKEAIAALQVNEKNPGPVLDKIIRMSSLRHYSFTENEIKVLVENADVNSINIIGAKLEAFRYLDLIKIPFRADLVKLANDLLDLKIPKEQIPKVWWYSFDASKVLKVSKADENFKFGLEINTEEKLRSRAEAVLFLLDKNLSPNTLKIASYVFRKSSQIEVRNAEAFLKEPSLPFCEKVLPMVDDDIALALKIGRNIYLDGSTNLADVNQTVVEVKIAELRELEKKLSEIKLWEGTNTIIVANNENGEEVKRNEPRFASSAVTKSLEKSIGKEPEVLKPADNSTTDTLNEFKRTVFQKIHDTPPPFRFIFNGHGGAGNLYLQNDSSVSISAEELGEAIAERKNKFAAEDLAKDVYIVDACFGHNTVRATIETIQKGNGVLPIFIGESEYGQFGFTPWDATQEMEILALGAGQENVTLDYLLKHESNYTSADMFLYYPNQNRKPQEVVKNQKIIKKDRMA